MKLELIFQGLTTLSWFREEIIRQRMRKSLVNNHPALICLPELQDFHIIILTSFSVVHDCECDFAP